MKKVASPLVSIVIPTHNRKEMLLRLVKSIHASTYRNIEIIIVDDASSDGTSAYIQEHLKHSRLTIIRNKKNLFTAGSRNVGLKKARGEFMCFIDDDNVVEKTMIEEMVKIFLSDEQVGEVGPVNYSWENKKKIFWTCTKRNMWTTKTNQANYVLSPKKMYWESDDVPNAFMVRASVVRKNKILFRETYGIMYEESDFAYRIRQAGYKIVVGRKTKIFHDIETTEKGKKTKDYMYHFMEDPRRPYVFAKNRLIFHSLYSTPLQMIGIVYFWIWFFTAYYLYKIVFYAGAGEFSLRRRLYLAWQYIKGDFTGLTFLVQKGTIQ